jgi:hypothetical protein
MNALLLPDLIQSMISWYLWKNKISLLNKQYHEVFHTHMFFYDRYHKAVSNIYNVYCVFNHRNLTDNSFIFGHSGIDLRINIITWKFNAQSRKYFLKGTKKLPQNYKYSNGIYLESTPELPYILIAIKIIKNILNIVYNYCKFQ